ncbi:hypothetical protein [Amycolatopsis sp. NPDC059657]|uniref:hypothetical protein n=1 Tax=Amycolatopsis sp. NPDC059657 TaxID=3346899 RepID=UPI00366C94E5
MGASYWTYRGKFDGDPMKTLHEIRERIFLERDYLWEEDEPHPASVEELMANEMTQECGTHSALDVSRFIAADDPDDFGTIRPLTSAQLIAAFGTEDPTIADYEREQNADLLYLAPRWSATCALLYENGTAVELALWGISGD